MVEDQLIDQINQLFWQNFVAIGAVGVAMFLWLLVVTKPQQRVGIRILGVAEVILALIALGLLLAPAFVGGSKGMSMARPDSLTHILGEMLAACGFAAGLAVNWQLANTATSDRRR